MASYKTITPSMGERLPAQDRGPMYEKRPLMGGAERLTRNQALEVARVFGQHIRSGLDGKPLSLATIPTRLQPIDKEKLVVGDEAVVVEVGGTHFRSSIITLDSAKDPQITSETLTLESKRKYSSTDEFFDELAGSVQEVIGQAKPKAIGIIWSFPADVMNVPHGIDAISTDKLTKELVIPEINTRPVGDFVIDALQRNGMDIPADLPRAVVNDTAAVLLANGATFGGIVATGVNFALLHDGQMYNLEAGGFDFMPQTALTKAVDSASERPGHFLAEKQISGRYVGDAFNLVLHELGITDRVYSSADMSAVLSGELFADNPQVREVAETLRDRSAQLVGAIIAGAIKELPEDFPTDEITVPLDGSFFGKTPGYKEAVEFYASDLLDNKKKIVTKYVKESGMKGAGVAALSLKQ